MPIAQAIFYQALAVNRNTTFRRESDNESFQFCIEYKMWHWLNRSFGPNNENHLDWLRCQPSTPATRLSTNLSIHLKQTAREEILTSDRVHPSFCQLLEIFHGGQKPSSLSTQDNNYQYLPSRLFIISRRPRSWVEKNVNQEKRSGLLARFRIQLSSLRSTGMIKRNQSWTTSRIRIVVKKKPMSLKSFLCFCFFVGRCGILHIWRREERNEIHHVSRRFFRSICIHSALNSANSHHFSSNCLFAVRKKASFMRCAFVVAATDAGEIRSTWVSFPVFVLQQTKKNKWQIELIRSPFSSMHAMLRLPRYGI